MVKAYQLINEYKSWTPEHHYPKFQEWRSLNKGTPKQRKEPLSGKRKQSATTAEKRDTLNLIAQNRSSTMMTQMRKTTRLSKTSQERNKFKKLICSILQHKREYRRRIW